MNKLRRIISLIISMAVMMSCFGIYAAADYTDIMETAYYEPVSFFQDLGIIEGLSEDEFKPEMGITRAEFAILLAKILGSDELQVSEAAPYTDVPEENPAKRAIDYLYSLKIMIGTSSTVFSPNEGMTYEYASVAVMKALGYDVLNYDENRTMLKTGIMKGMPFDSTVLTRGDACIILFRALTAPLIEFDYTQNGVKYQKNPDKTILSEFLNTTAYTGIVTATEEYSLYGDENFNENEISIDFIRYDCSLADKNKYIGHNVKYYVQECDDETQRVIAIFDRTKFSEVISYKNISEGTTIENIEYLRNGRTVTKKTGADTFFVYNGAAISQGLTNEMMLPEYGELEITDNDNDGIVDVVIIRDYDVYQIESVLKSAELIKFRETDFIVDIGDEGVIIMRDGVKAELSEIKRGDVAVIMVSKDGSKVSVKLSGNTVTATVTAVNYSDEMLKAGENEYGIIPTLKNISAGLKAELYLDCFGNVAFWEETRDYFYGWLINVFVDTENNEEDVILRIFTEKGETEKLIAAEKVNIYQGAVRIDRVSAEYISEYFTGKQMIRYKVNANGEINALYKYNDVSAEDFGCDGFVRNIVSTGRCYYHTKGYIYDQYNAKEKSAMLDENAVIFNFGFSDDGEEGWTVVKASEIKTSKYFERMEVFDLTEFGGALCVLVYETELQIFAATDPIMLVEKSYLSLNEDDETELTLSGISHVKGAELTVKAVDTGLISNATAVAVEKNIPISSVKAGDVIQCNLNAENEIISWRLLNRAQDDEERAYYMSATAETITGTEVSGLGFYGRICSSNDKYFTIDNEYLPKKRAYKFIDTDNQVLLRFYKKSETVERIEKGDIYNGMTAFIYAQPESGYVFIVEYRR